MSSIFLKKNMDQKTIILFIVLYTTLIISFILGENSTGGALGDYLGQKK